MESEYADAHLLERDELVADIERDKERLAVLQNNYQKKLKRLELLNQLINVEASDASNWKSKSFEDHVADILSVAKRPMSISDLYDELINRRVPIPGKGTIQNVVTRVSRATDLFERARRGTYELRTKGEEMVSHVKGHLPERRKE